MQQLDVFTFLEISIVVVTVSAASILVAPYTAHTVEETPCNGLERRCAGTYNGDIALSNARSINIKSVPCLVELGPCSFA
jgi:hypothetical protein